MFTARCGLIPYIKQITFRLLEVKRKIQSHYRPGQALRVPGSWGYQISRHSAHEGGRVVSRTHRPPLPHRKYSWYSFLLEAESASGPQCGRKDYVIMTSSGMEPVTFRLVVQCLNQLRHQQRAPVLGLFTLLVDTNVHLLQIASRLPN